jgi:integrase/recombinase XerD
MTLHIELDRYLTLRRSLGYKLREDESVLRRFLDYAASEGGSCISTELFLRWQGSFGRATQQTWGGRYSMVRLFAEWLHGQDQCHEIPPRGLVPRRAKRPHPYIYSDTEIASIVTAAAQLPSIYGLRGLTYSTFFGLIAATGLRISEAVGLDIEDVNLIEGSLYVRSGKFGKDRQLPLESSVVAHLCAYAKERDRLLGQTPPSFFVKCSGKRIGVDGAQYNFAQIGQRIGLREAQRAYGHGLGPRIHDLRHSFAVRTMIGWYRAGKDPAREMIKLSTWLGHADPKHTYWYIEAVPELLDLASQRAENSLAKEMLP